MSKDDWGDNSNAAMFDHKLAYHAAMHSLDKKEQGLDHATIQSPVKKKPAKHNPKPPYPLVMQSLDNRSVKVPTRRVPCNCKKCMLFHPVNCYCSKCVAKIIQLRGLKPSTEYYNLKVSNCVLDTFIKDTEKKLMEPILLSDKIEREVLEA